MNEDEQMLFDEAKSNYEKYKGRRDSEVSTANGLRKTLKDLELSSNRTILVEGRNREDAEVEAQNNWQTKVGGPMAAQGVAQRNYERWNKKLTDAQAEESNFKREMMKKYGFGADVNLQGASAQAKMTQEERDRYANLHGDVVDFEGRARSARYEKMGADYDRKNRAAELRAGAMQQGNRLTAMGLGGDVSADFAKSTAGNTKELVSLTKEMLKTFRGGMQGKRLEDNVNRWTT